MRGKMGFFLFCVFFLYKGRGTLRYFWGLGRGEERGREREREKGRDIDSVG